MPRLRHIQLSTGQNFQALRGGWNCNWRNGFCCMLPPFWKMLLNWSVFIWDIDTLIDDMLDGYLSFRRFFFQPKIGGVTMYLSLSTSFRHLFWTFVTFPYFVWNAWHNPYNRHTVKTMWGNVELGHVKQGYLRSRMIYLDGISFRPFLIVITLPETNSNFAPWK